MIAFSLRSRAPVTTTARSPTVAQQPMVDPMPGQFFSDFDVDDPGVFVADHTQFGASCQLGSRPRHQEVHCCSVWTVLQLISDSFRCLSSARCLQSYAVCLESHGCWVHSRQWPSTRPPTGRRSRRAEIWAASRPRCGGLSGPADQFRVDRSISRLDGIHRMSRSSTLADMGAFQMREVRRSGDLITRHFAVARSDVCRFLTHSSRQDLSATSGYSPCSSVLSASLFGCLSAAGLGELTGAAASISCVSSRSPMAIILWTFSPFRRWIIPGNPRLLRCKRCSPARPSTCGRSPAGELNPGSLGCDRLSANDSRGHGFVHGPALPASFHDVPRFLLDVSIVASVPCSIEVARLAKVSRWRHQA